MLGNIEFGITVARRAWCEKDDIFNCQSASQLKAWLGKRG